MNYLNNIKDWLRLMWAWASSKWKAEHEEYEQINNETLQNYYDKQKNPRGNRQRDYKPLYKPYDGGYNTPSWCGGDSYKEHKESPVPEARRQNNDGNLHMKHQGNGAYHLVNENGDVVGTVQLDSQRNKND